MKCSELRYTTQAATPVRCVFQFSQSHLENVIVSLRLYFKLQVILRKQFRFCIYARKHTYVAFDQFKFSYPQFIYRQYKFVYILYIEKNILSRYYKQFLKSKKCYRIIII